MESNLRGWINVVGALVAAYLAWQDSNWAVIILAALFLVSGIHHITHK